MTPIGCCLSIPRPHSCGTILEKKGLKTSFNSEFLVDYCPKCEIYSYHWGREDTRGIVSRKEEEVIDYIEAAREIIKQKHLENISRI